LLILTKIDSSRVNLKSVLQKLCICILYKSNIIVFSPVIFDDTIIFLNYIVAVLKDIYTFKLKHVLNCVIGL